MNPFLAEGNLPDQKSEPVRYSFKQLTAGVVGQMDGHSCDCFFILLFTDSHLEISVYFFKLNVLLNILFSFSFFSFHFYHNLARSFI